MNQDRYFSDYKYSFSRKDPYDLDRRVGLGRNFSKPYHFDYSQENLYPRGEIPSYPNLLRINPFEEPPSYHNSRNTYNQPLFRDKRELPRDYRYNSAHSEHNLLRDRFERINDTLKRGNRPLKSYDDEIGPSHYDWRELNGRALFQNDLPHSNYRARSPPTEMDLLEREYKHSGNRDYLYRSPYGDKALRGMPYEDAWGIENFRGFSYVPPTNEQQQGFGLPQQDYNYIYNEYLPYPPGGPVHIRPELMADPSIYQKFKVPPMKEVRRYSLDSNLNPETERTENMNRSQVITNEAHMGARDFNFEPIPNKNSMVFNSQEPLKIIRGTTPVTVSLTPPRVDEIQATLDTAQFGRMIKETEMIKRLSFEQGIPQVLVNQSPIIEGPQLVLQPNHQMNLIGQANMALNSQGGLVNDGDINELVMGIFTENLINQINLDSEIEKVREALLQQDFRLSELFKIFDVNGNGVIGIDEFVIGLNAINLLIQPGDLVLILRRFSTDSRNIIMRYSEFAEIFLPSKKRGNLWSHYENIGKENHPFNPQVIQIISTLLNLLINVEKIHELNKNAVLQHMDALSLFKLLDQQKKGYLKDLDFIELLLIRGLKFRSEDFIGVLRRFNKNNSGRINYNDFSGELRI